MTKIPRIQYILSTHRSPPRICHEAVLLRRTPWTGWGVDSPVGAWFLVVYPKGITTKITHPQRHHMIKSNRMNERIETANNFRDGIRSMQAKNSDPIHTTERVMIIAIPSCIFNHYWHVFSDNSCHGLAVICLHTVYRQLDTICYCSQLLVDVV